MGKLVFAGNYSKKCSKDTARRNELGIDFDEVILECNTCNEKTSHKYMGYNQVLKNISFRKIKFNYKCNGCGGIQSFFDRK